jgi:Lipase (class 3)
MISLQNILKNLGHFLAMSGKLMPKVYLTGHSLGAARACLYAYYRLVNNLPVDGVYLFGCPNPGNKFLGKILSSVPVISFKNRRDLITDVPVDLELFGEEYVQVAPFIELNEPAPIGDKWGIFSDHHSELYQSGVNKMIWPQETSPKDAINAVVNQYNLKGNWSWEHTVNGQYCSITKMQNGDNLVVFRGSTTSLDWTYDFDAIQIHLYDAKVSQGFWGQVNPIKTLIDQQL